jgi:uncharacterized protein (TIGR03435 family)
LLLVVATAATLSAQATPVFEVASVKRQSEMILVPPSPVGKNTFRRRNATVAALIRFGYRIASAQLVGGPDWIRKDLFDIDARAPRDVSDEELRLMVRQLLQDRFALVMSKQQRDMRYFVLALAREGAQLGPKLTKCEDPGNPPSRKPIPIPPGGVVMAQKCVDLSTLSDFAAGFMGAPVFDRTGLGGGLELRTGLRDARAADWPHQGACRPRTVAAVPDSVKGTAGPDAHA